MGTPSSVATAAAASTFDTLPTPSNGRRTSAAPPRGHEPEACSVDPKLLERGRADVGHAGRAKRHGAAAKGCGPFHDQRVVGVADEHIAGRGAFENLGLGLRNRRLRLEVSEMRVSNVGPDPNRRLGDVFEQPNFTGVIHPQLHDSRLGAMSELE